MLFWKVILHHKIYYTISTEEIHHVDLWQACPCHLVLHRRAESGHSAGFLGDQVDIKDFQTGVNIAEENRLKCLNMTQLTH